MPATNIDAKIIQNSMQTSISNTTSPQNLCAHYREEEINVSIKKDKGKRFKRSIMTQPCVVEHKEVNSPNGSCQKETERLNKEDTIEPFLQHLQGQCTYNDRRHNVLEEYLPLSSEDSSNKESMSKEYVPDADLGLYDVFDEDCEDDDRVDNDVEVYTSKRQRGGKDYIRSLLQDEMKRNLRSKNLCNICYQI